MAATLCAAYAYKITQDKKKPKIKQLQKELYERASDYRRLQIAATQKKASQACEN